MAMMHAAARVARNSVVAVATFDHGTGTAATRAASLVGREATALGFPVVLGHSARRGSTEAEWRAMRLAFLGDVARATGAVVATAHTRDDQVETVLMRVLRDAGARGLAGLYASGDIVRPVLDVSRAELAEYAKVVGARWVEDPTNTSTRHLRNRLRRDLLPALSRVRPGFEREVLAIARSAADWRGVLEGVVAAIHVRPIADGIAIPADALRGLSADELAVVWPAIAARAGVRADWRGLERIVGFTRDGRVGSRIPLSGGWEVARTREAFELRAVRAVASGSEVVLRDGLTFDRWTFSAIASPPRSNDAWFARLPAGVPITVRRWQAGDRMRSGAGPARRVKRYLTDARVSGALRPRWPVVLAAGEVTWIPGVRHGVASDRDGQPEVLFRCELNDR
jgi:tRNA(Ile)-lysidine synthase